MTKVTKERRIATTTTTTKKKKKKVLRKSSMELFTHAFFQKQQKFIECRHSDILINFPYDSITLCAHSSRCWNGYQIKLYINVKEYYFLGININDA